MPSGELDSLIERLRALGSNPPTSTVLRDQVATLASQVAQATGASVRLTESGVLQVAFYGRNAVAAVARFRRLAGENAESWGEMVAAEVVGRLT